MKLINVIFWLDLLLKIENLKIMSNLTPEIKSQASKFGLISAAIIVGYTLIAYLVDMSLFTNTWLGALRFVVLIVVLILAVNASKKLMGGYISFGQAFTASFITSLIGSLISTAFTIILFDFIDKEAAAQITELAIEASIEMMEKFGATDTDAIDKMQEELRNNNQYSTANQAKGFFYGLIFYAVLSLVIAAFTKKNQPLMD